MKDGLKYKLIRLLILLALYDAFIKTGYWLVLFIIIIFPGGSAIELICDIISRENREDKAFLKEIQFIKMHPYRSFKEELRTEIIRKRKLGFHIFDINIPKFITTNKEFYKALCEEFDKLGYRIFVYGNDYYVEEKRS